MLRRTGVAARVPEAVDYLEEAAGRGPEPDPPAGLYRIVASNRHAAEVAPRAAEGHRLLLEGTAPHG